MADTFKAAVTSRLVGAYREFVDTEELVNSCCKLGAESESVVGEESGWTSPEGYGAVHQNVGSSFSCKFCGCDCEHVRSVAEAVREEEDVRISSGGGR